MFGAQVGIQFHFVTSTNDIHNLLLYTILAQYLCINLNKKIRVE